MDGGRILSQEPKGTTSVAGNSVNGKRSVHFRGQLSPAVQDSKADTVEPACPAACVALCLPTHLVSTETSTTMRKQFVHVR